MAQSFLILKVNLIRIEKNPFKEVYDIIQDVSQFNLDNEDFSYNNENL